MRPNTQSEGLGLAGAYALNLGDYREARHLEEEALSIFKECGRPEEIACTFFHLGHLSGFVEGDYPAARKLYQEGLSVATVKRHISNIYLKLGAKSRTQAVSLGKELGLFEKVDA